MTGFLKHSRHRSRRAYQTKILAFLLGDAECGRFIGGAERRFFEVSSRLRNLGSQIFVIEYDSFHSERFMQNSFSVIKVKRPSRHAILDCLKLVILGSIICLKKDCDIFYVNNIRPWKESYWSALIAPYIASRLCRKPMAIILHHLDDNDAGGYLFKRMAISRSICMAVSKAAANDFRKYFDIQNISIVGNGINLQFFEAPDCRVKLYDAVFLGRVTEDKGVFELLRAWTNVVTEMPSAQLLFIGGFDEATRDEIYKTVHQSQLENNVTFSGFVNDEELVHLLGSSKTFVLPSHQEGFGLAVIEAMAAGLPCIISDLPATREAFSSAALFVQPKNVQSLTEALIFLLSHPEKAKELQEKGKKLAYHYSWNQVAAKEFAVLSKACNLKD